MTTKQLRQIIKEEINEIIGNHEFAPYKDLKNAKIIYTILDKSSFKKNFNIMKQSFLKYGKGSNYKRSIEELIKKRLSELKETDNYNVEELFHNLVYEKDI